MSRFEDVENTLLEIYEELGQGVTATDIALRLNLDRSNVSRDLNELVRMGKCYKNKSRPVLFLPLSNNDNLVKRKYFNENKYISSNEINTNLDLFSQRNPSLIKQIELGKSAILYPSYLMHMLLLGETGVGKSMFAKLLFDYGVETNRFKESAPFIQFNCADYAHNPQLLMSHLFGSTKGAFTGADVDRTGLLKQADEGVLFLDEIHRLPIEGQEMLFTYMDRGTFKPLGETEKEYSVKVLLIGATTDNKESLLSTFTRRIPITIDLPNLKSRSIEERFKLFDLFTQNEVNKLGMKLKISTNSIKAFLSYNCEHNVGQLKMDIRIVFAKAYAQNLTKQKEEIVVVTNDLPDYIQEGLFLNSDHRIVWSFLENNNNHFFDYSPVKFQGNPNLGSSIYQEIEERFNTLEDRNLSFNDIQKEMERDFDIYINSMSNKVSKVNNQESLVSMIPESTLTPIEKMIEYAETLLERSLSLKAKNALSIHLFNLLERTNRLHKFTYEKDYKLAEEYPKLYGVSQKCVFFLSDLLNVKLPVEEANYLVLFFSYDDFDGIKIQDNVQVIVIAHGSQTATALSDTVNKLLRTESVVGINARLDEKPQQVYESLKKFIDESKITKDILLLVDMGSLMTFARQLEEDYSFNVKAIPLVSTMHVLEAARKSMLGYSLIEVYEEIIEVNNYLETILKLYNPSEVKLKDNSIEYNKKPLAVLSICMTGEGTAITMQKMLEKQLKLSEKNIKIIPLNLVGIDSVHSRIKNIQKNYRVIFIASTFHIETKIPNFDLYNLMSQKDILRIEKTVQEEMTYRNMAKTIRKYYEFENLDIIINLIFSFNEEIEDMLTTRFNSSELIGLSFHIIGMIIKNKKKEAISPFIDSDHIIQNNLKFSNRIQQRFSDIFEPYFEMLDNNYLEYIAYSYLSIRQ